MHSIALLLVSSVSERIFILFPSTFRMLYDKIKKLKQHFKSELDAYLKHGFMCKKETALCSQVVVVSFKFCWLRSNKIYEICLIDVRKRRSLFFTKWYYQCKLSQISWFVSYKFINLKEVQLTKLCIPVIKTPHSRVRNCFRSCS